MNIITVMIVNQLRKKMSEVNKELSDQNLISFGVVLGCSFNEKRWEIWRFINGRQEGLITSFYDYGRAELMARQYNKRLSLPVDKHNSQDNHNWECTDIPGVYSCECGKYSGWNRVLGERVELDKEDIF